MENNEQNSSSQVPAEANRHKDMNYRAAEERDISDDAKNKESEESQRQKLDSDNSNDDSSDEMLQKENLIDPGNEHHHT